MTRPSILLDSGAYSAFHQGDAVELSDYITFVRRQSSLIERVINLDIIPDPRLDADQIKATCEQSYRNLQTMKDAGLNPMPVVHQVDGPGWLERYLIDREPAIALAPLRRRRQSALRWLHLCFATIRQTSYQVQVHGLGVTNSIQMTEFPWASVDSSTWVQQAGRGNVLMPVFGIDDRPDYRHQPKRYCVTDRMHVEKNHIDKLDDFTLDDLRYFIHHVCELSLTEVRYDHNARWRALIKYFRGLEAASGARLYFVSDLDAQMRNLLLECGAENHLLSFFKLRQLPDDMLDRYVEGTLRLPKPRGVVQDYNSDGYIRHRALAAYFRLLSYGDGQHQL
jgi:hypothetical protein